MAIHIEDLDVIRFRGIRDLVLRGLNHVNIIAGDNNSGKTSILEAINLLKNPMDLYNLIRTSLMREEGNRFYSLSAFDSFLNMLSKDYLGLRIEAYGEKMGEVAVHLHGEMKEILLDKNQIDSRRKGKNISLDINEMDTMAYVGYYECDVNTNYKKYQVEFNGFTEYNKLPRTKDNNLNVVYLSPSRHLTGNNISNIVKSPSYKELCVYLLQLFDEEIDDILYVKNDFYPKLVECIRHKRLGIMPLSTYGDGIKKVISLANGIATAKDGILMIDEVETSIHKKYYEDIFAFLIKACQQYNVQLFMTTHNEDAMDAILDTQKYIKNELVEDILNVITFRNGYEFGKTLSRSLPGNEVKKNREGFEFEVFI